MALMPHPALPCPPVQCPSVTASVWPLEEDSGRGRTFPHCPSAAASLAATGVNSNYRVLPDILVCVWVVGTWASAPLSSLLSVFRLTGHCTAILIHITPQCTQCSPNSNWSWLHHFYRGGGAEPGISPRSQPP